MALVERLKSKYTITAILNALVVPRSTYYRWRSEGADSSLTDVEHENTDGIFESYTRYNVSESDGRFYLTNYEELDNVRLA